MKLVVGGKGKILINLDVDDPKFDSQMSKVNFLDMN